MSKAQKEIAAFLKNNPQKRYELCVPTPEQRNAGSIDDAWTVSEKKLGLAIGVINTLGTDQLSGLKIIKSIKTYFGPLQHPINAYSIYGGIKQDGGFGYNAQKAATVWGYSAAGTVGGGALGSLFGPAGTAIGCFAGSYFGGESGAWLFEYNWKIWYGGSTQK